MGEGLAEMEEIVLADLREAVRQLRKAPGVTTTAVVTLALGIGATTAIFTLVHQVMLKSLPVAKPEELWRIGDKVRCCNWGGYTQGDGDFSLFSGEAYKNFRTQTPEFVELAALQAGNAPLGIRRAGSRAPADTRNGQFVSGNFFRTFGVQPWIGRLMTDEDDAEGAPPVAVLSYRIWNDQKYAADTSVVGATRSTATRSLSSAWRRRGSMGRSWQAGACPICGVDIIKIDKLFINSVGTDRHSNTIIETLIDLAQNMRMDVIAEGVESFEQVLQLRDLGIRAAQGFVFSPPLPCSAFLQLVETIDPLKASAPAADQPTAMLAALVRHDAA